MSFIGLSIVLLYRTLKIKGIGWRNDLFNAWNMVIKVNKQWVSIKLRENEEKPFPSYWL